MRNENKSVFYAQANGFLASIDVDQIKAIKYYAEKACQGDRYKLMHHFNLQDWRFCIISPEKDKDLMSAVKQAINNDESLTDKFKKRIFYFVNDSINYALAFYERYNTLLHLGYDFWLRGFCDDKPWLRCDRNYANYRLTQDANAHYCLIRLN